MGGSSGWITGDDGESEGGGANVGEGVAVGQGRQ